MKKILLAIGVGTLVCLGSAFGGYIAHDRDAYASRNSAGTMSIPNTFVAGTTISSSSVNANFADIGTELTNSLERNGKGGMLADLRGVDGTLAAPAFSWTSETGSGLFRNGAADIRMSVTGTLVEQYATTGITVPGNLTLSGATSLLTLSGATIPKVGIGATPTYPLDVGTAVGWATGRFRNGTGGGMFTIAGPAATDAKGLGFNVQFDGANWKYDATATGASVSIDSSGNLLFQTTPSGTAGNTATMTERMRVNPSGVTIGSGGTAISASFRGTAANSRSVVSNGTCVLEATITITGATAGTECITGNSASTTGLTEYCNVTANTCSVFQCNIQDTGNITPGVSTLACRVFNP